MYFGKRCGVLATLFVLITTGAMSATSLRVRLTEPSLLSIGNVTRLTAEVSEPPAGTLWYRFRAREAGQPEFRTVVDYGPNDTLDWTQADHEGLFEIEVSIRRASTPGEIVNSVLVPIRFLSRIEPGTDTPVLSRTNNPLVQIYSAPACPDGASISVLVTPGATTSLAPFRTPAKRCVAGQTMNFYVTGLPEYSRNTVQHVIQSATPGAGAPVTGPILPLNVGPVSPFFPRAAYKVSLPATTPSPLGVVLQSLLFIPTAATDLAGNLLWYYDGNINFLTRPEAGGRFWGIVQMAGDPEDHQAIRLFDLAGTTLAETNAALISEQLIAKGLRPITAFHHEVRSLPEGKVLALATSERLINLQENTNAKAVLGDTIVVLDRNLQLLWSWDSFDHLDVNRQATLKEVCTPTGGGCPPFRIAPKADDWLHTNSLQLTPDGNILASVRHQDWVIKIDYANGKGTGNILWKLGKDGDFRMLDTSTPEPWFSHQHDSQLLADNTTLAVYDNGNIRRTSDSRARSRGQILTIDEKNRTASFLVNADLGVYAPAVGAAQVMPGGGFFFNSGYIPAGSGRFRAEASETDSAGKLTHTLQINTAAYRSFRMADLYTPPN